MFREYRAWVVEKPAAKTDLKLEKDEKFVSQTSKLK